MGAWITDVWKHKLRRTWKLAFFSAVIIGLLVHMFKLVNVLPYWDSLLNHHNSQDMVASGRWFLSAACSLSSWYDLPWINGLTSLLFLGITAAVVAEHFQMKSSLLIILSSGLLVTYPAVTTTLAYNFTADGYMLAMLLAAVAASLSRVEDVRPNRWKRLAVSGILLCLSCGIYQAYISFAFMLCVGRAMLDLLEGKHSPRKILRWIGAQLLIFGCALAVYYGIWKLCLGLRDIPPNTYQGMDALGGAGLGSALYRILRDVLLLLLQWDITEHGLTLYGLLNILTLAGFVLGLCLRMRQPGSHRTPGCIALLVLLVISIPFGIFIWNFVSAGTHYRAPMLQSAVVVFILTGVIYDRWLRGRWADAAAVVLAAVICSNSISANVFYDQMHLRYERDYASAVELMTRIHLLDDGSVRYVAFCGEPEPPAFDETASRVMGGCSLPPQSLLSYHFMVLYTDFQLIWYEQNGEEWPAAENYLEYPAPRDQEFRFPLLPQERMANLEASGELDQMPLWPAAGSVIRWEDSVVVRFS